MAGTADIDELIDALASQLTPPALFQVREVGIIKSFLPSTATSVSAPQALVVSVDGHLGLHSWVLNALYIACKARLCAWSSSSTSSAHSSPSQKCDFPATTAMLVVNPDFLTAWNVRKALFSHQSSENNMQTELHFSLLMLTRSPKSADTWSHRNWVLKKAMDTNINKNITTNNINVDNELKLAWMTASRAKANYYASVHRVRVLTYAREREQVEPESRNEKVSNVLVRELKTSREWLGSHVTDSSGWAYHRFLLTRLDVYGLFDRVEEAEWFAKMHDSYSSQYQNVSVQQRWLSSVKRR